MVAPESKCNSLSTALYTTETWLVIQDHKIKWNTYVYVATTSLVSDTGNCGKKLDTDEREICYGISGHDETHNKKIFFFKSLQVKHGFKTHTCRLWHSRYAESSRISPDADVYLFPRIYGDWWFLHATY